MLKCGTYEGVSFEREGEGEGEGKGTVQMIHLHRSYMLKCRFFRTITDKMGR